MSGPLATARPYRNDDPDWWAVRRLLVEGQRHAPPQWNWDIRHWDGSRFHNEEARLSDGFAARTTVWEAEGGRIVAAVHPEGDGGHEAYLSLDPAWRHLEPAMLERAEATLAADRSGLRTLHVTAWDYDLPRRRHLADRGYRQLAGGMWLRRTRPGHVPIPEPGIAAGYRMRTTRPVPDDAARMAALLNASFGRSFHTAAEYATFMAHSPSFRHDLNLVAEAPDGSFAAHVGVTFDEDNGYGVFEPVCTAPAHVRRGLARTLMFEGLRRLRDLGAAIAHVETGDAEAANAFYVTLGFTEEYRAHTWRREWDARG